MKFGAVQDNRKIYRVSELTRLIRIALENEFGSLWIEGEISNLRRPASGHLYFTLKDESAQLAAVFFKGSQRGLILELKDGLKVRIYGEISVYETSGQYQLIARKVEEAGKGGLQEAFEALKARLAAEGLFDESRKKPIPVLPQRIGIVTSPTGAAIHDILNVLSRRFPNLHIVIAPVKVQGEGAAREIADAIDRFNERGGMDVMIVGRGGGNLEDLWCFNEEIVARAIARSRVPIISAVGHEIDFTISDFVADLRAPTPSAAAELMIGRKVAFEETLRQFSARLARSLRQHALEMKNRLLVASRSYVFREPQNLVRQFVQRIDGSRSAMTRSLQTAAGEQSKRLDRSSLRLSHDMGLRTAGLRQDIRRLSSQLKALSPLAVLDRGFSITRLKDGTIVRDAADVRVGGMLQTQVARGTLESKVSCVIQGDKHGRKEKR
jgi:exodeoxyribonuclease VII large subunit